jgi:hypothetical protein
MKIIRIEDVFEVIEHCKKMEKYMNVVTNNKDAEKIGDILKEVDSLIHLPSGEFMVHEDKYVFGNDYASLVHQIKNIFKATQEIFTEQQQVMPTERKEKIITPKAVPQDTEGILQEGDAEKIPEAPYQEIRKTVQDLQKRIKKEVGKYIDQEKALYSSRRERVKLIDR